MTVPLHQIRPLTEKDLESAFTLASDVFVRASTLHRALGAGLDEYRRYLRPSFENMITEGLSVGAFEQANNRIIGCLIATDFSRQAMSGERSGDTAAKGKFAPLSALTRALSRPYCTGRTIPEGEVVLADMGAVSTKALGTGVYQTLRKALARHARKHGFSKIIGELSSRATQHVVIGKSGHRVVGEIRFSDFAYEGKTPFARITDPESIILAEGLL